MSRVKCPRGEKPVTVCLPEDTPTRMAGLGGLTAPLKCARGEVPVCTPRYAVPGLSGLDGTFKHTKSGVTLDKQPTRGSDAAFPKENIFRYGPFGVAAEMMLNLPRETYMLYCFDTEANCSKYVNKVRAGAMPVLFKRGMGMQMGEGPISEIFKRTPVGCIAVYLVSVGTSKGWEGITYVDMMSVKEPWQRQNINTMMMRTLQQWQPDRKIEFSNPTHAGKAFITARGFKGVKVPVEQGGQGTYRYITLRVKHVPNKTMRGWGNRTTYSKTAFVLTKDYGRNSFNIDGRGWYVGPDLVQRLRQLADGALVEVVSNSYAMQLEADDLAAFSVWLDSAEESGLLSS